jgi:uncharacterized peroxidase-related enzyme
MPEFRVHDSTTAPNQSKPVLEEAQKTLGFVPNLYGMLAESPALLNGYTSLSTVFEGGTLSPTERQVVLLSTSFRNGCDYCMAAHTAIAGMHLVPQAVVEAIREGRPIDDAKLRALESFTSRVVECRGWVPEDDVRQFLDAGYSREQVLEVVLGVGLKTLSNYANHLAKTPLDAQFEPHRWSKPVHAG